MNEPRASASTHPLLSFDDVRFAYPGAERWALDGVSFAVGAGEACALTGANGCGKSTAFRLLLGLDYPVSGTVCFDGEVVDARSMARPTFAKRLRQRVGFVFQDADSQLFCPTVRDEVAFGPRQMGLSPEEVQRRTDDCLRMLDLTALAQRATWRLSGGEKRRCALACVISMAPDVLCLDEPTNDLDKHSRARVVGFLQAFVAAGKTVLVATHDQELVAELDARVVSWAG